MLLAIRTAQSPCKCALDCNYTDVIEILSHCPKYYVINFRNYFGRNWGGIFNVKFMSCTSVNECPFKPKVVKQCRLLSYG